MGVGAKGLVGFRFDLFDKKTSLVLAHVFHITSHRHIVTARPTFSEIKCDLGIQVIT